MAPAVAGRRAVRSRAWRGEDVGVAAVLAQLNRLQVELAYQEHPGGEPEHPHPRNCVMNLVVAVPDAEHLSLAERVVAEVAASHPLRALLVRRAGAETAAAGLDAEIVSEVHHLVNGAAVQREQVTLVVRGAAGRRVTSLVEPLLCPDVPTYLWWAGSLRLDDEALRDELTISDFLIVDSACFEQPVASLLGLASLAASLGDRVGFADLRWARQRFWREGLAQVFAARERRPFTGAIRRVTLACAGEGPANRLGAVLLAGWLASALGWRLRRGAAVSPAEAGALWEAADGEVSMAIGARTAPGLEPGELIEVTLEGGAGGRDFSVTMALHPERGDHANVEIVIGGMEALRQRLAIARPEEPELLVRLLAEDRRDPVFRRSLAGAATLLGKLR